MKRIKVVVCAVVMGLSASAFAQTPWGWNHNNGNQPIQPLTQATTGYQDVSHRPLTRNEIARIESDRMEAARIQVNNEQMVRDRLAREHAVQMQARAEQQAQMNRYSHDDRRFGEQAYTPFYFNNAQHHMSRREIYAYRHWRAQKMAQQAQERQQDDWNRNSGHGVFSISFRN